MSKLFTFEFDDALLDEAERQEETVMLILTLDPRSEWANASFALIPPTIAPAVHSAAREGRLVLKT